MEKRKKKGKRKKDIALLHTGGMLKHVKTFNPIHSDHVDEATIVLKRAFFLFDIRDNDEKHIRDIIYLRTSVAVFFVRKDGNLWE